MQVKVETITPDIAAKMLELNTGNFRKLDRGRVGAYSQAMTAGKWAMNGETIKMNGEILIDGQHRLAAVVDSGVTIESIVVRGVKSGAESIDRGKPRTIGQWLQHEGIKNANEVAAIARQCVIYEKGLWARQGVTTREVVDHEIIEFAVANEANIRAAIKVAKPARMVTQFTFLSTVLYYGCQEAAKGVNCDESVWFCEKLRTGEQLESTDPVLHLRNRFLQQTPQSRLDPFMKKVLITLAWNKTARGESSSANYFRVTGPRKQQPPKFIVGIQST